VIDHLPEFHLYDPYVTKELRIKDLFTHNSGVGNSDYLWTDMQIPSAEIISKMAMVEPSYSFRGGYTYQNIFYLIAGTVIQKISGMSWADYTKEKIFIPLGMTRSQPLKSLTDGDPNLASPHDPINKKVTVIQHSNVDAAAPAGAAWSTAEEVSK
jgi:CubicO group peptidase (beta-lactamase class C family)